MLIWMLFLHLIGDFVLQSHRMASNKSKSANALMEHVTVYTVVLTLGFYLLCLTSYASVNVVREPLLAVIYFAGITFGLHITTDFTTSRITSKLFDGAMQDFKANGYDGQKFGPYLHDFFVIIGLDQFLHALALWWTLRLFGFNV